MTNPVATALAAAEDGDTRTDFMSLDDIHFTKLDNSREESSYTDEDIQDMAYQIMGAGGLIHPLSICEVEPSDETNGKKYVLLMGFRRTLGLLWLAENEGEHWKDNVFVKIVSPRSKTGGLILQGIENIARKNYNPMEVSLLVTAILNDNETGMTQKELARVFGMSEPAISQIKKLTRLPKSIQALVSSGKLSFSHVRDMMSMVPEDQWPQYSDLGTKTIYDEFKRQLEKNFKKTDTDADSEEEGNGSTESSSGQKRPQMLRNTELANYYLPFLNARVKEANTTEKAFTAADVETARLDTIKTVLKVEGTNLAELVKPFIVEHDAEEEAKKAKEDANKNKDKFLATKVKEVRDVMSAPIDPANPDAPRPALHAVVAAIAKEVIAYTAEQKKELGFELDTDKFAADLHTATVDWYAAAKKRKEEKEAKAAEAAAKAEAEAAAKAEAGDAQDAPEVAAASPVPATPATPATKKKKKAAATA